MIFAALMLAMVGEANAGAESPSLGFVELAQRALSENPWILAKRARGRSLAHTGQQKMDESNWRGWDLGLDTEYYPGTGGSTQLAGYDTRVSLGLTVPLFGTQAERNLRLQEIQADQAILDGELGETKRLVMVSLLGHYLAYWRGVETRESLAQIADKIQEKRRILTARVREGESLPAELLEAERDFARIVLRIEQNREATRFALEEMRSDLGDPLLPEFLPQPLPWREMAASKTSEPVEAMASRAIQGHPMVLGLERKIRLLHEQEDETSRAYPRSALTVGLVSQMGGASGNESGPAVSFSMSLPLGVSRITAERRKAIAADRDRYHADFSRKCQEIGAEIRARFQDLLVSREKARLAASQWNLAAEQERVAKLQLKELPDLAEPSLSLRALDSEIDRIEASMQKDAAESDLAESYCRVFLAVDRDLPKEPDAEGVAIRDPLDLWVWSAEIVFDHGERRRFFDVARSLGVSGIYLGLDLRETEALWEESPGTLRGFLAECHERGIRVECLLAENSWASPEGRAGLQEMLGRLSRFQAGSPRSARYDALHLDVEPHALPDWGKSPGAQAALVQGYLDLLAQCRQQGLPLHADLPSWYERISAGETNLLVAVLRRVEGVVIMNYRTDAERFRSEAEEELRSAAAEGKTVRIAVSAEALLPQTQAFRDWDALVRQLEASSRHFRGFESFAGFAVQSFADLAAILPGSIAVSPGGGGLR